jgi:hypothetical protein
MKLPTVTRPQFNAILAALRFYQAHMLFDGTVGGDATLSESILAIARDGIKRPLGADGIESLCTLLNIGE